MQKKTDKFLDKIVKKNYHNELEKVLEKKAFDEDTKNMLLSIMYKIDAAYKDYEKVKPEVEEKEEFMESLIQTIEKNCDEIKLVKVNTEENTSLGNKTFLVQKDKKRILCHPVERKLLYCIAKIGKKENILKDKYTIMNKTWTDLLNVGNSIHTVEPLRDFNGYSWTTLAREIESIYHNIVYQNIRILVGEKFLNNWIKKNEFMIDYMETFQDKLEEEYGNTQKQELMKLLNCLSVLLAVRYQPEIEEELRKEKKEVEEKLEKWKDNKQFVKEITTKKHCLSEEIKRLDEVLNNSNLLQEEYERRNEFLPLQEKIFSSRILSKMMVEEREEKIKELEELNHLLNPQKFVALKKELEGKEIYLKWLDKEDLEEEIKNMILQLQKVFLLCYQTKVKKVETKQELLKLIYEFRYYCFLPFDGTRMGEVKKLQMNRQEVERLLIEKAHVLKLIDVFAKNQESDFQVLKNIFHVRVICLEDLYSKVTKEQDDYFVQLFDEDVFEEKIQIEKVGTSVKLNKKIRVFN